MVHTSTLVQLLGSGEQISLIYDGKLCPSLVSLMVSVDVKHHRRRRGHLFAGLPRRSDSPAVGHEVLATVEVRVGIPG